jgi:methyl-accepting chemotaxis protein
MLNRRRNYFINKRFQVMFIINFCILVIAGTAVSGGIIYWMSRSAVTSTFENSRLVIKSTADFILPSVLLSSIFVIIAVGFATIVVTLFTSHRIAGPLYRMQKDLEAISQGDLNVRFSLRKNDEIKALADTLNDMTEVFRRNILNTSKAISEAEAALKANNTALAKDKLKDALDAVGKFKT